MHFHNIATVLNGRKNINRMGEAVSIVCIISAAVQMLAAGPATIIISFLLSLFGLYCVHRGRAHPVRIGLHIYFRVRDESKDLQLVLRDEARGL